MKAMTPNAWAGFLGQKWAQNWQLTDRTFGGLTEHLLDIVKAERIGNVLDVGCGAGELCLHLARDHREAQITGVDVSQELVEVAQERLSGVANAEVICADAASWQPEDGRLFDLVLARHVVMFFEDPAANLRHLASLAACDARLVFTCFRSNEENGWIANILDQLPGAPEPRIAQGKPSPLAFSDPEWVTDLLEANGWHVASLEAFDYPMVMGEGDGAIAQALDYLMQIGPASFAASQMQGAELEQLKRNMRELLEGYCEQGRVALPAAVWIGTARRQER